MQSSRLVAAVAELGSLGHFAMSTTSPDIKTRMAELKNAPVRVRRVAGFGALLGFVLFLRFCASAFAGHVTWGRAVASGVVQFLLFWLLSVSVQDRRRLGWWALLALIVFQMWGALGHTMRLVRVTIEGGLATHGREIVFDAVGMAQFIVSGLFLWLLLTREVRDYVRNTAA